MSELGRRKVLDLYKQYFYDLFNYGMKISGDKEITADSIQDLFLDLYRKRNLDEVKIIKPYLFKCLRNIIIDSLKKNRPLVSMDEQADQINSLSSEDLIIRRELDHQTSRRLKQAFDNLSVRQKEIVYLRFYNGLSYAEIADVIGITNQSVRNHFSLALKHLRKHMITALTLSALWTV